MIDFSNMFKQFEEALDQLPPEIKGRVRKLNSDCMKIVKSDKKTDVKKMELQHLHQKFNLENGITSNK